MPRKRQNRINGNNIWPFIYAITGINAAVSTGLFRLACLNMSACTILTVTLPRLRGYWHQMGWR
jgi:hypothetical protein